MNIPICKTELLELKYQLTRLENSFLRALKAQVDKKDADALNRLQKLRREFQRTLRLLAHRDAAMERVEKNLHPMHQRLEVFESDNSSVDATKWFEEMVMSFSKARAALDQQSFNEIQGCALDDERKLAAMMMCIDASIQEKESLIEAFCNKSPGCSPCRSKTGKEIVARSVLSLHTQLGEYVCAIINEESVKLSPLANRLVKSAKVLREIAG